MNIEAKDFKIVEDGITDNASDLMNMRAGLTFQTKQRHTISFAGGTVLSSNTRWIFGFYWLRIIGNGVTLRAISSSQDEMMNRPLSMGELLQNNVLEYIGTKCYKRADRIGDVPAGSNRIPTLSFDGAYKPTDRILLYQGNYFADGGYPPPCPGEKKQIESIDEHGIIYTTLPVEKNYSNNQWDNQAVEGGGCGKPRMINLDDPNNIYPEYIEIDGVIFGRSTSDQPGNLALRAGHLKLIHCKIDKNSYFWPTESEFIEVEDCEMGPVEFDKLCREAKFHNVRVSGPITGGGAFDKIAITNSSISNISVCPRYLEIRRTHISSNFRFKSDGYRDYYVPGLCDDPSLNPIRRLTIEELTFSSSPESLSDAHIGIGAFCSKVIDLVIGKSILIKDFDIVKTIEPGTTVIYEQGAKDGGLVTSIQHDGTYFVVSGNWNKPPVIGSTWRWSYIREVIDLGGHRSLDGKRIWHERSLRWKGNTSTGPIKEMHLTEQDFLWKAGGNGNLTIEMDAFIESIECFISKPYGDQKAMINIQNEDYTTLFEVNTKTERIDFVECKDEWVQKLILNTFSVTGGVTDDLKPRLSIVVRHRPF